jgi:hypothetical protein
MILNAKMKNQFTMTALNMNHHATLIKLVWKTKETCFKFINIMNNVRKLALLEDFQLDSLLHLFLSNIDNSNILIK